MWDKRKGERAEEKILEKRAEIKIEKETEGETFRTSPNYRARTHLSPKVQTVHYRHWH